MGSFRRLNEGELGRLSDEALVDYIVAAREAGERDAEKTAVCHLAFGFERTIFSWVRMGMRSASREEIEDVVMEVHHSAIKSSFEGKVIGEFGAFLKRIAQRRVADFYRQQGRRLDADPLPEENQGDESVWGKDPYDEDFTASAELQDVIDRVLEGRSDQQREVIRLYGPNVAGFLDLPADEVAARIEGMSVANVHKIWSRFKQDLGRELPMADARELLAEFVAAFEAGDTPDPNALLERAPEAERQELADLIDHYLMTAPRQAWDPDAYETSLAKVAVEQVYESIEGVSGSWPELLPQLRNRARVKRSELVRRLAEALGVGAGEPQIAKVADYYNRMEHGLLPADGVSSRVIEAFLGSIVGVGAEAIRAAGRGELPRSAAGGESVAFARKAIADPEYSQLVAEDLSMPTPPALPGAAPGRDEIDELFTGG